MNENRFVRLVRFFRQGLWDVDLRRAPPWRRFGLGFLKVALHVIRSFSHNLVGLQAAGLTLVTLLALVPMLALVFALARVLGYAQRLETWLLDLSNRLPAETQSAVDYVRTMVAGVNFGTLGVLGSLVVAWMGLVLFIRVEQALNGIWRTRHSRPWLRRISDFVALVVLVPPLVVLALVGSSLLGGVQWIEGLRQQADWLAWAYEAGLGFVPHVLLWIALAALYKFMPSTHVRWRGALAGGIVAGSTLVVLHGIYLRFQVGVAQANAIYATLAALPLLLIYLQLLWTVVLAGGEVGYAIQNLGSLRGTERLPPPTYGIRQRVLWHLMQRAGAGFRAGKKGVHLPSLCMEFDLPRVWIDDGADLLVEAGLLLSLRNDPETLVPSRPPEQISMNDVLLVLEGRGNPYNNRVRLPDDAEHRLAAAAAAVSREVAGVQF